MFASLFQTIRITRLDLPATEVFLLIGLLSLAILLRFPRCGLMAAYVFTYRWCWSIAADLHIHAQFFYAVFGVIVGALAVIGMLKDGDKV